MKPFANPLVKARFDSYPPDVRPKLLALRELVFRTAAATDGVGEIEESLKWGEPAYATRNKSGSTLRIDWKKTAPQNYAMYFNCQTTLVDSFRSLFPDDFEFQGTRALLFPLNKAIPQDALAFCIAAAMTYHLKKRATSRMAKSMAKDTA